VGVERADSAERDVSEPNPFEATVLRSLATLETQMEELVGNGQPGRISSLERRVARHDKVLWLVTGAGAVIGWLLRAFLH